MMAKEIFPDDQVTISVTNAGPKDVFDLLELGRQVVDVLELSPKEAVVINAATRMAEFKVKTHTNEVVTWRAPWGSLLPEHFAEQIAKVYGYGNTRDNTLRALVEMRHKRDTRQIQPWAFTVPPILLRMLKASGISQEEFAQAMGYKDGNFYTNTKLSGIARKLKIDCPVAMQGHIKNQKVAINTIILNESGAYISRNQGMDVEYRIHLPNTKLASIVRATLLDETADKLVDNPIVKAMLSEFFIREITEGAGSTTIRLSPENDVHMAPEPESIQAEYERLLQKCHDWGNPGQLKEAA